MLIFEPFGGYGNSKMSYKKLIISASRMKFKNPFDAPESILLRGLHTKFDPIWPRGLGCRGGAIDFGPTTSYNSRTSVVSFKNREKMGKRFSPVKMGRPILRISWILTFGSTEEG